MNGNGQEQSVSRRTILRGMTAGALALGGAGLLSACGSSGGSGGQASASGGGLDAMKKRGYALYGFDGEKPYNYTNTDGNVVGIEIELARHCFTQIGVPEVQAVAMDFNSFIPALQAGRIDTCLPIYVKPERCSTVDFCTPDLKVVEGAVVKAGNPKNISNWTEAFKSGARLGLQNGATSTDIAKGLGVPSSRITLLGDFIEIEGALRSNRIDIFIDDNIITGFIAKDLGSGYEYLPNFKYPNVAGVPSAFYAAYPFSTKAGQVRDAFSEAVKAALADGTVSKIRAKYGVGDSTIPGSDAPSMAKLCAKS